MTELKRMSDDSYKELNQVVAQVPDTFQSESAKEVLTEMSDLFKTAI